MTPLKPFHLFLLAAVLLSFTLRAGGEIVHPSRWSLLMVGTVADMDTGQEYMLLAQFNHFLPATMRNRDVIVLIPLDSESGLSQIAAPFVKDSAVWWDTDARELTFTGMARWSDNPQSFGLGIPAWISVHAKEADAILDIIPFRRLLIRLPFGDYPDDLLFLSVEDERMTTALGCGRI